MDFMKWLGSLDEFLYEVMSWAVFFPLTLWRTATRPLGMMAYSEAQLAAPPEARFEEALSPPVFLTVAMLLSHGVAVALGEADALIRNRHGLGATIQDDAGALAFRILCFAVFPLVMSVLSGIASRSPLTRTTLRPAFYAQCYPAAAFALLLSTGVALGTTDSPSTATAAAAIVLVAAGFCYYLLTQTRWMRTRLRRGYAASFMLAAMGLVVGLAILFGVGLLFTR